MTVLHKGAHIHKAVKVAFFVKFANINQSLTQNTENLSETRCNNLDKYCASMFC